MISREKIESLLLLNSLDNKKRFMLVVLSEIPVPTYVVFYFSSNNNKFMQ